MNGYSSQGLLNVFFVFVTTDAGFMMECSNWSGSESLNLQFMVPKVGTLSLAKFMYALGHLILVRTGRPDLSSHIGLFTQKSIRPTVFART